MFLDLDAHIFDVFEAPQLYRADVAVERESAYRLALGRRTSRDYHERNRHNPAYRARRAASEKARRLRCRTYTRRGYNPKSLLNLAPFRASA